MQCKRAYMIIMIIQTRKFHEAGPVATYFEGRKVFSGE